MPLCTHMKKKPKYPLVKVPPSILSYTCIVETYMKILAPSKSNSELYSTSHYKKSTTL